MKCYLCGKESNYKHSNGIDRINNDIGYTEDNIACCCAECNYMKNNYQYDDFIEKFCTTDGKGYNLKYKEGFLYRLIKPILTTPEEYVNKYIYLLHILWIIILFVQLKNDQYFTTFYSYFIIKK